MVNKMRQQKILCTEGWGSTCSYLHEAQVLKDFLGRGEEVGQNEETNVV